MLFMCNLHYSTIGPRWFFKQRWTSFKQKVETFFQLWSQIFDVIQADERLKPHSLIQACTKSEVLLHLLWYGLWELHGQVLKTENHIWAWFLVHFLILKVTNYFCNFKLPPPAMGKVTIPQAFLPVLCFTNKIRSFDSVRKSFLQKKEKLHLY